MPQEPVLSVRDLEIAYAARRGLVQALRGVSFDLSPEESLALIGESGSGKTTLGLSIMRLVPAAARVVRGSIVYRRRGEEVDVLRMSPPALRLFRWQECAMVFQSALNAFNPVLRIWDQIYDTARAHGLMDRRAARERARELLRLVRLEPDRVIDAYPHELSGGMRQRVLLAIALFLDPPILLLDEPTTALDILTQRAIIDLLRELKESRGFAMIFISHDLSLAAELADRVATLYAGEIVEIGPVRELFYRPAHPYTMGLLDAVPRLAEEYRDLIAIPGSPPDLIDPPPGCAFHPRCPLATAACRKDRPPLDEVGAGHRAACWHWEAARQRREEVRAG